MPLLKRVAEHSLADDYVEAAGRDHGGRRTAATKGHRKSGVMAVLALSGLLVGVAAAQATRDSAIDQSSRAVLVEQIEQRQSRLESARVRVGTQRSELAAFEADLRTLELAAAEATSGRDRRAESTGFAAVTGPGIRVVVDDAGSADGELVQDTDLAQLVNAIWGVGAEAIAVNGERVTSLSAIRNVGPAIHVNGRPLSAPYVVEAIGDDRSLQSDLVESRRGDIFFALAGSLGFESTMTNQGNLELTAAPPARLGAARVLTASGLAGKSPRVPEAGATPGSRRKSERSDNE
jgi:uncharacterized protein YlxW (UPF0749 family)